MIKIAITGGSGMIGANLVRALRFSDQHYHIICIDNFSRGQKQYIDGLYDEIYEIDLREPIGNKLRKIKNVNVVVHLADIVGGIKYVFENEYDVFSDNLMINTNTYNWMAENSSSIRQIIYVGTACSFPKSLQGRDRRSEGLLEMDLYPADPESGYGWSKLVGQKQLEILAQKIKTHCTTLMLHNVYGEYCNYEMNPQVIPALIHRANLSCMSDDPTKYLDVWGDGSQARDFIHVYDVCQGIVKCIEREWQHPYGLLSYYRTLQLGSGKATTIRDIAQLIIRNQICNLNLRLMPNELMGDHGRFANIDLAREVLDWQPTKSLDVGIHELNKWISDDMKTKSI